MGQSSAWLYMETHHIAFVLGEGLVPAENLKGDVYRKFEEGSEAAGESPRKGKRGWSRSRDKREDFGD